MIKLENYEKYDVSGFAYGGQAGSKLGIIIDNEFWLLSIPKTQKVWKMLTFHILLHPFLNI